MTGMSKECIQLRNDGLARQVKSCLKRSVTIENTGGKCVEDVVVSVPIAAVMAEANTLMNEDCQGSGRRAV
jgi:hypothetical protein